MNMFRCIIQKVSYYLKRLSIAFAFILVFNSCNNNPIIPKDPVFSITAEDASCIEVWLRIKLDTKTEVNLFRNDSLVKKIHMTSEDTLIVDDGLLPNQTYYYRAETEISNRKFTEETSIHTMDTTSHNFSFRTWNFGNANNSGLKDVVIISENNIWCVGEIYIRDTSEIGYTLYNAIHWDGNSWNLHRIWYYSICGQPNLYSYEASGIISFNDDEITIAALNQIARLKGTTQLETVCSPLWVSLYTIWGVSNQDFYLGGYAGTLIHYKDGSWKKIATNTNLPIRNLYGTLEPKTDKYEILCVGDAYDSPGGVSKVFSIKDGGVEEIGSIPFGSAVWFVPNRRYIVVGGDGLWEKRVPDKNWERKYDLPPLAKSSITGQGYNDIFVGGSFWLLGHWNGYTWETYFPFTYGGFAQVKMNNNVVAAVGIKDRQAVVVIGKR